MSRILFDVEGNGFLPELSKVHCIASVDVDTEERRVFGPHQIEDALDYFGGATLIAHHGLGYDFPALEKLYGFRVPPERQLDTLVIARLMHPNVKERDSGLNAKRIAHGEPTMGAEFGKHTLRAWGQRLRIPKANFEGPWDGWTQEMQDYCVQDVETNLRLWRFLDPDNYSQDALLLEHRVARLCRKITDAGWPFNEKEAGLLHARLVELHDAAEKKLVEEFKGWEEKSIFVPRVNNKARGYVKGVPFEKKKWVTFNPYSRDHCIRVLKDRGWEPTEFTDGGKPKMDEEVIESLAAEFPQADTLVEYLMLGKRIGQLASGNQAWLKHVKNGRIHGDYNPMGAVTSRASHFNPNIAQVPAASSPWGHECRALFTVPEGWELVGADMSSLEGLCLAHYLAKHDGGEYGELLLKGDPHWAVVIGLGFLPKGTVRDKSNQLHTIVRETGAKRGFYAMLYGCGDEKLGKIILEACRLARKTNPEWGYVYEHFWGDDQSPNKKLLRKVGKLGKFGVISNIKGFSKLKNDISYILDQRPTLPGLDKRRLPVRSEHAALNTLLQSAGAILCKRWICDAHDMLLAEGLQWARENPDNGDFYFVGWVHDELQVACRKGLGEQIGATLTRAAQQAGEPYKFRMPLSSSYKIGKTWAETH